MKINTMVKDAHENAKEHGWHDEKRSFGELIALCHSELSEALEDYRHGRSSTETYYEISDETVVSGGDFNSDCKPCGIPSELADVVIRIADMCGLYGIDLEQAIKMKMAYNATRPYRHGGKTL